MPIFSRIIQCTVVIFGIDHLAAAINHHNRLMSPWICFSATILALILLSLFNKFTRWWDRRSQWLLFRGPMTLPNLELCCRSQDANYLVPLSSTTERVKVNDLIRCEAGAVMRFARMSTFSPSFSSSAFYKYKFSICHLFIFFYLYTFVTIMFHIFLEWARRKCLPNT